MPLWVENEVEKLVHMLEGEEITEQILLETKTKLTDLGLGSMFPTVIDRLFDRTGEGS